MEFALHLLRHGIVGERQLAEALAAQRAERTALRLLAVELGLLTPGQVCDILSYRSQRPMRFGEAARALGYLSDADVETLLGAQRARLPKIGDLLARQGAIDPRTLAIERGRPDTPSE
jgi:hypothetical protein